MKLILSQNLRKLRRDRGLTQEELAAFLGISPQSVSKWERDEGYPDITMLPVIANYFAVTVDALIGSDMVDKGERVKMYAEEYERLRLSGQKERAYELAEKAYREYPYEWEIIYIYINSLTKEDTEIPTGEKMAELRALAKLVIDKCPDGNIRRLVTYRMLYAEDDDKVEFWFEQVSGTYDFTECERREDRYRERVQEELYRKQKQENIFQLYSYLVIKLEDDIRTPEQGVVAYEHCLAVTKAVFQGKNADVVRFRTANYEMKLAEAYAKAGRMDEAREMLAAAESDWEKWFSIPDGTELKYETILATKSFVKNDAKYDREGKIRRRLDEIKAEIG